MLWPGLRITLLFALFAAGCVNLSRPAPLINDGMNEPDAAVAPDRDARSGTGDTQGETSASDTGTKAEAGTDVGADGDTAIEADAQEERDGAPPAPRLSENGEPCAMASECSSGVCAAGTCCATACDGLCQACDLAGSKGTCTAVPAGQDPRAQCEEDPPTTCGRDGSCDGKGACRRLPAGTVCALGRCTGATEFAASTCNEAGTCVAGPSRSCAPNMCTSDSCASGCTTGADCQTGFFCDAGACRAKRAIGIACQAAAECASGSCADGVCCNSDCTGTCFSCNLATAKGHCTAVPNGQDPAGECPAQSPSSCGRAGACNGAGACLLHAKGTLCAAATCTGSTALGASVCNGNGMCVAPAATSCGAYACTGAVCATSCSSSASCKAPNVCTGSTCGPACNPETDATFCARLGKTCGQVTGTDNCGSARTAASCGSCSGGQTCGGGGTSNVCGATAASCATAYKQSNCTGYTVGTKVSSGGHNWSCANGNCANCATNAGCAPGGSGCPWGTVWTDGGACQ